MLDRLIELDRDLFVYLNKLHTSWLDSAMYYISGDYAWIPLYLFLLFLVYKKYKRNTWIVLIGITLTIVLSDQITTGLMKPYFMRLRPSHDPQLQDIVHIVNNYQGGLYGFASSHAANTFGAAMFFWLVLRSQYRKIGFLFLWATIVSYTRIYLGVHYPGDVFVGACIGVLSAVFVCQIFKLLNRKIGQKNKSLERENIADVKSNMKCV